MEIKTTTTIKLDEKEILDILGCQHTSYGYKSVRELDQYGFSNICIEYFFKKENGIGEKIKPQDALNLICDYLVKEGIITTYRKGTAKFNPTHCWGSEDDEGYRCSCWNVSFNMTISEKK